MVPLTALLLAVVVSAVLVHVTSFLLWAVLPWHKSDWRFIEREDAVMAGVREAGLEVGQYTFPRAGGKPANKRTPEEEQKVRNGPMGSLILWDQVNMPRSIALALLSYIAVSFVVAYLASRTVAPGAEYLQVFRVTGTAAILAYVAALPVNSIWFGHRWSLTLKSMLDGVLYGLLTAGVFGWLWPGR